MMKRIITVLTVATLMAIIFVASAGYAFAYAYSEGDPGTGPSQGNTTEQARDNCGDNYTKQAENEVATGGGPKEGEAGVTGSSPTNCDHFYQGAFEEEDPGSTVIGKNK
jgi:hypothetical protein